jgi:catechol 2,3-dioxygenase-like lactoylglutathione lyase family enzyme
MASMIDSRTVLAVRNLRASTQFYMDVLGFQRDFGDESGVWSFLSRDRFKVMLGECPADKPAGELGSHSTWRMSPLKALTHSTKKSPGTESDSGKLWPGIYTDPRSARRGGETRG